MRRQQPRDRYGRFVKKGNGAFLDAAKSIFSRENINKRKKEFRYMYKTNSSPLLQLMGIRYKGRGLATDALMNNLSNQVNKRIKDAASETVDGIFDALLNKLKRLFKRNKKPKPTKTKGSNNTSSAVNLCNLSAIDRRKLGI